MPMARQRRPVVWRIEQHDFVRSGQTRSAFRQLSISNVGCRAPLVCQWIVKFVSLLDEMQALQHAADITENSDG